MAVGEHRHGDITCIRRLKRGRDFVVRKVLICCARQLQVETATWLPL